MNRRTTARRVRQRLEDPSWSSRRLAGILMDQSFLAGLGNYLRSEVLFVAGIDPESRARDLSA